jgi:aspartate-semialdehyde dehydrogenase
MTHRMKGPPYHVAVVGASSLLGKELISVLEERKFPVSRLVKVETETEDPELPILDLEGDAGIPLPQEEVKAAEVDFAFLAGRPGGGPALPEFLRGSEGAECVVIDLDDEPAASRARVMRGADDWTLSAPFLDREFPLGGTPLESRRLVSAHPASIVISGLLLRLSRRAGIERAVAQVFGPVSEIGSKAIEELQKQTVNLLSFQKTPEAVFGGQLAFNVLPRLARSRRGVQTYRDELSDLQNRVQSQLRAYLAGRAALPAVHLVQVPVFHSLAISLYVETDHPVAPESAAQALAGERIRLSKFSEPAPSPVRVTGSSDILVDAITADGGHATGIWIWATADNMRLAAVNALDIAEACCRV